MPLRELPVGLVHSASLTVTPDLTVPQVSAHFGSFEAMPAVFATAYLVGFVEATCIEALAPFLAPGERTVGTKVELSHSAATPVGLGVTAEVELIAAEGRRLRFRVACRDEREPIGGGFHERFLIDLPRFEAGLAAKTRKELR